MMSCFNISLLVVLFGVAAGLTREYMYFPMIKTWIDAQEYCEKNYKGLAVITSDEEHQRLIGIRGSVTSGWIGMYRSPLNTNIWLWEDGKQSSFFRWKLGEPNNRNEPENCVQVLPDGWNDRSCGDRVSFYCYRILVLVKEKKTWEEALDYCRRSYTGLATLTSETQLQLAKKEGNQTQTDGVWTGLRFLDGKWLWVSKEPLGNLTSLPSCPAANYRCGAHNTKIQVWENRDCSEKLNFLCY